MHRNYMAIAWGTNKNGEVYTKFAPIIYKENEFCFLGKQCEYVNDKIDIGTICELQRDVTIAN